MTEKDSLGRENGVNNGIGLCYGAGEREKMTQQET